MGTGGPGSSAKSSLFSEEKPTSVVESYKTTYGDKTDITVVLMSVVSEEQKTFARLELFSF